MLNKRVVTEEDNIENNNCVNQINNNAKYTRTDKL